ncbi:hypothetical protein [Nocardia sp. NPDC058114]
MCRQRDVVEAFLDTFLPASRQRAVRGKLVLVTDLVTIRAVVDGS